MHKHCCKAKAPTRLFTTKTWQIRLLVQPKCILSFPRGIRSSTPFLLITPRLSHCHRHLNPHHQDQTQRPATAASTFTYTTFITSTVSHTRLHHQTDSLTSLGCHLSKSISPARLRPCDDPKLTPKTHLHLHRHSIQRKLTANVKP